MTRNWRLEEREGRLQAFWRKELTGRDQGLRSRGVGGVVYKDFEVKNYDRSCVGERDRVGAVDGSNKERW